MIGEMDIDPSQLDMGMLEQLKAELEQATAAVAALAVVQAAIGDWR